MVKQSISIFLITQVVILLTYFISFEIYINIQIAFLSSFFIIVGSAYAYRGMISKQVELDIVNEGIDLLDSIEDPHELYDDTPLNETPAEELNLKEIVAQEKKKIKIFNLKDVKKGSSAGFSAFRLVPYIFLILSFIALENNKILNITIYLPSLLIGIIVGYSINRYITNNAQLK